MLQMREIRKLSEQGCTQPFLCLDENGVSYWCKGCFAGLNSLRNEWICGNLAKKMGLPVPEFAIAEVRFDLFDVWRSFLPNSVPMLVTKTNPYVFASKNVAHVKDVQFASELKDVDEKLQAQILLFDQFVRNMDRNDRNSNLLVTLGIQRCLYVIDHNLAFDNEFARTVFLREHVLRNAIVDCPQDIKDEFQSQLRGVFTLDYLQSLWSEMPTQWTDDDGAESHLQVLETLAGGVA